MAPEIAKCVNLVYLAAALCASKPHVCLVRQTLSQHTFIFKRMIRCRGCQAARMALTAKACFHRADDRPNTYLEPLANVDAARSWLLRISGEGGTRCSS